MGFITKFAGYQADSDLSASDWTKRWNTAATATVIGIGYTFLSSNIGTALSPVQDFTARIPSLGTYLIGLTSQSVDTPGVQGVSVDGQLGQELFEFVDGPNFVAFWIVNPTSFHDGNINVVLNSAHKGLELTVTQLFGGITNFGDSATGLTSGATDTLTLAIRNVLVGLAQSGTGAFVGNTASTRVLLHMDGVDASTTFTDSSSTIKTWTAVGNAQIDTAQSKFGGASGLFDGTGDYITTPDTDQFVLGNLDFTIDFWFNCNKAGGVDAEICGQTDGTAALTSFFIDRSATNVMRFFVSDGTTFAAISGTTQFTNAVNTGWHHLAAVRSGNTMRLFIDGIQEATGTFTGVIPNQAGTPTIGRRGDQVGSEWLGWIDEFRIVVGFARWTANFIPPTSAYVDGTGAGNASEKHFWGNLNERLDQFISGSNYWSAADLLLIPPAGVTTREIVAEATENPTTLSWAALAFYTPVTYFPSGQGVRFAKQSSDTRAFWSWDTVPQMADVEVLALVRPTAQNNNYGMTVVLRGGGVAGAEDAYSFGLRQTSAGTQDLVGMVRTVAGTGVVLTTMPFAWSLNTNYWIRFRARGTTLQGRIWRDGLAEPVAWNIETTDSALTSGRVGISYFFIGGVLEVGHFEAKELATAWPEDTIPNNWSISIQGGPQLNKVSFKPDVGPTIDRRRASSINRKYQVEVPGLTQEEYLAFVEFYHTTLQEGTLPFTIIDPFTGVEKTFKFGSDDPGYTESIQRSPGADYTNGIYLVGFNVVRLD